MRISDWSSDVCSSDLEWSSSEEMSSLQSYIQDKGPLKPLRNEIGVLSFAEKFISHLQQGNLPEVVTPSTTQIAVQQIGNYVRDERVIFRSAQTTPTYRSIYTAPDRKSTRLNSSH